MRSHPLIRHPVGRMSAAARWYLAGIAMLTLIFVAMHFALQVYAQQEAKRLVSSWAKQTGFSVSDVRYRMLRGALTLIDVRFNSERLQAYAPTLFLHGNLSSLSGEQPQATRVEIRGAVVSLTEEALKEMIQGKTEPIPDLFYQLWNSTQRVGIYQTRLKRLPDGDALLSNKLLANRALSNESTVVNLVRLESAVVSGERRIEGLAHWLGGEMALATHTDLKDGAAYLADGSVRWKGLDAAVFLDEVLSLNAQPGRLSGRLIWEQKKDDHASYSLSGRTEIEDSVRSGGIPSLIWDGNLSEGAWKGEVKSVVWPLAIFSSHLLDFQHYRLVEGKFDGAFRLTGNLNRWQMDMTEAELSDIRYRKLSPVTEATMELAPEAFPEWHVEALHVSNARLQWPGRNIDVEEVTVRNTNFLVDSRGVEPVDNGWNIEVKEIGFDQLTPVIRLSEELFYLPMLEGHGSLEDSGRLQLEWHSSDVGDEELTERWHISGDGMLATKDSSRFRLEVNANRAALVRFRPFMPDMIRRDASSISGDVDMALNFQAGSHPWEGSGEASITDAHLQYGGEQWFAKVMKIEFDNIGPKLKEQQIHQVDVQGWHYQAALRPLDHSGIHQSEVNETEEPQFETERIEPITDEAGNVSAERWYIQNLQLNNGLIMVGHADAVWADSVEVRIRDLRPGAVAPVEVKAKLGSGSLAIKGSLDWDAAMPKLHKAKILVRDTLPFFMNDWLTVSSIPPLIRGRIYSDISLQKEKDGAYKGLAYLRLQYGMMGPAISQSDPLLSRAGFNTHDIFTSLQQSGRVRLRIPLQGEGAMTDVIGDALIKVIKEKMEKQAHVIEPVADDTGHLLSSVRLHGRGSLSQNERTRLRKIIRHMRKNPKQSIELRPQLSLSSQDGVQVERARYTQQLIEKFLARRYISRSRIFPVWPSEQHRSSSSTSGIGIVTIP
ncbi:MAG: hypothetical protein R8K54_05345 [Mariprofundaceae bacterium]